MPVVMLTWAMYSMMVQLLRGSATVLTLPLLSFSLTRTETGCLKLGGIGRADPTSFKGLLKGQRESQTIPMEKDNGKIQNFAVIILTASYTWDNPLKQPLRIILHQL